MPRNVPNFDNIMLDHCILNDTMYTGRKLSQISFYMPYFLRIVKNRNRNSFAQNLFYLLFFFFHQFHFPSKIIQQWKTNNRSIKKLIKNDMCRNDADTRTDENKNKHNKTKRNEKNEREIIFFDIVVAVSIIAQDLRTNSCDIFVSYSFIYALTKTQYMNAQRICNRVHVTNKKHHIQ